MNYKQYLFEEKLDGWEKHIKGNKPLQDGVDILNILEQDGKYKAYIVGGAVRDIILGIEIDDIDIATNCPMEKTEQLFKTHDIGANKNFGIIVAEYKGNNYEISMFRSDGKYLDGRRPESVEIELNFEKDASRRDLSINAMAIDKNGDVIDYFNGQEDIKNKVIRTVGNPYKRFSEDYLRMLRSVRFASRLGYDIDNNTRKAIETHASKISDIAIERVMKEIMKMANQIGDKFAQAIIELRDTGLLQYILPEIVDMDNFDHMPSSHPEGNLWSHVIESLRQNKIADPIINLAILFHDIGKPPTYSKDENDIISYIGHAKEGVNVINKIANRLKLDNKTRQALIFATENHMKMHNLLDMSNRKVYNLIKDENWNVLLNVAMCDAKARRQLFNKDQWDNIVKKVEEITKKYKNHDIQQQIKQVINGRLVMRLLNLQPGKQVGIVINKTMDWIVNNNIPLSDNKRIEQYILKQKQ